MAARRSFAELGGLIWRWVRLLLGFCAVLEGLGGSAGDGDRRERKDGEEKRKRGGTEKGGIRLLRTRDQVGLHGGNVDRVGGIRSYDHIVIYLSALTMFAFALPPRRLASSREVSPSGCYALSGGAARGNGRSAH